MHGHQKEARLMYGPGEEDYEEVDPYEDEDDMWAEEQDPDSPHYLIDGVGFAEPGGRSALRAATEDNPRNLPCPSCGRENMLTPIDRQRGYQCNICADEAERGW
jgi:hypothetical protein